MEIELYICRKRENGARRWMRVLNALPNAAALFVQARAYGDWAIARHGVLLAWSNEAPIAVGGLFEQVRASASISASTSAP